MSGLLLSTAPCSRGSVFVRRKTGGKNSETVQVMAWKRERHGLVREGTGTTVHDERGGGLRVARIGTVEPVPDALGLSATESARLGAS